MTGTKTRLKKKQELDCVLNDVFQLEEDNIMQLILRGPGRITSVETLLGTNGEDLMSFKHVNKENEPLSLNRGETSLIRALKGCVWHLNATSESIGNDFLEIDPQDFDDFRISDKWTQMVEFTPAAELDSLIKFNAFGLETPAKEAAPTTSASASTPSTSETADAFKRGVKRETSLTTSAPKS